MGKAQSAIELTMMISFMFLVFFIFFLVLGNRMSSLQKERDRVILEDMTNVIKGEIFLASSVEDGYSRKFDIPETLNGLNFTVDIIQEPGIDHTELVLKYVDYPVDYESIERLTANLTGTLIKGQNSITKEGIVCINVECP